MSPRGVYARKHVAAPAVTVPPSNEAVDNAMKSAAEQALHQVEQIGRGIRIMHERISSTVLDIGGRFFEAKKVLDNVPVGSRKFGAKSFTLWMNTEAPTLCGMSKRTAWFYYREYAISLAAGLSEKTITALAPSLLRSEKPRKAAISILQRNPDLTARLNEAARSPREIQTLAKSEPFQQLLTKVQEVQTEQQTLDVGVSRERIKRVIVSTLKPFFPAKREDFNLDAANTTISDLVYAVREATQELKINAFVPIGYAKMTEKDADALYGSKVSPQPAQQDLVTAVSVSASKAIAGAATA